LLRNNSETGKIWSKQVGLREHFGSDKFLTCSSDMAKFFAQIVCSDRSRPERHTSSVMAQKWDGHKHNYSFFFSHICKSYLNNKIQTI
jgi:hypothetical protein